RFTTFAVLRPVGRDPFGQEEVRRYHLPASLGCRDNAFGIRRNRGHDDWGMWQLQWLRYEALPYLGHHRAPRGDLPVISLQVIRRLRPPELEHHVYGFDEHRRTIVIKIAERLRIGKQAAGRNAEVEAPIEHVIEHGD